MHSRRGTIMKAIITLIVLCCTLGTGITVMLPCEPVMGEPCAHDCCDPVGGGIAGQCVEPSDAGATTAFLCQCQPPFVLTEDSKQCQCPGECPSGTFFNEQCECECPEGEVCLGARCIRRFDDDDWYDVFFNEEFSNGCSECTCGLVNCREDESGAWPDRDGDCACIDHADDCVDSSGTACKRSRIQFGRFLDYFQPTCATCKCEHRTADCQDYSRPLPMHNYTIWEGTTDCGQQSGVPQSFSIIDIVVDGNIVLATVSLYALLIGQEMKYRVQGEYDEEGSCIEFERVAWIVRPTRSAYTSMSLRGYFTEDGNSFIGLVPQCDGAPFVASRKLNCPEGKFASEGLCESLTICAAGQIETLAPTTTSDRRCEDCNAGVTYQDELGKSDCKDVTPCPSQVSVFISGTATSDQICSNCDGVTTFNLDPSNPTCLPIKFCNTGQIETQPPTFTSDRVCYQCDGINEYSNVQGAYECLPTTPCQPGQRILHNATSFSDRVCAPCEIGTYQNAVNQVSCISWTNCKAGEGQLQSPTSSRDRFCVLCILGTTYQDEEGQPNCKPTTTCGPGAYQTTPPSVTSDRKCMPCTEETFGVDGFQCIPSTKCTQGLEETVPLTPSSDRECQTCPDGTYKALNDNSKCNPYTECTEDQFELYPGTKIADRVCSTLTECDEDQYIFIRATATSDRSCLNCTACDHPGGVVFEPCSEFKDSSCQTCPLCESGFYFKEYCSVDTPADCAKCTVCPPWEYQAVPCLIDSDAVCVPLANCTSNQFEAEPPTISAPAVCQNVSECSEGEFELLAPTSTSDRVCTLHSGVCRLGFYESSSPTKTTDRSCTICDPGTSDHDSRSDTPCKSCSVGSEAPVAGLYGECSPCASGECDCDKDPATPCTLCPAGTFQLSKGKTECFPFSNCTAGYEAVEGSRGPAQDTECRLCPEGEFKATDDDAICQATSSCPRGQVEVQPPSPSSDRKCQPCEANEFENDGKCTPVSDCQRGFFESKAPTASSDRDCMECPQNMFKEEPGNGPCIPVRNCTAGQEERRASTSSQNRICSFCVPGETFKLLAGQDTQCVSTTDCPEGQEELEAPSLSTDRQCINCVLGVSFKGASGQDTCQGVTNCGVGEEEIENPTRSSDRRCDACEAGVAFKESAGNDLKCQPISDCNWELEYEAEVATPSTDRQCRNLTLPCKLPLFEFVPPTKTSNRICTSLDSAEITTAIFPSADYDAITADESTRVNFIDHIATSLKQQSDVITDGTLLSIVLSKGSVVATIYLRSTAAKEAAEKLIAQGNVQFSIDGDSYSATPTEQLKSAPKRSSFDPKYTAIAGGIVFVCVAIGIACVVYISRRYHKSVEHFEVTVGSTPEYSQYNNPMFNKDSDVY